MNSIRSGLVVVLILTASVRTVAANSEDEDYRPAEPQPTEDRGFPWLCFATSIAGMVGLFFVVRRREQKIETDAKLNGRKPAIPWYCRTCDRDVVGPECSRCHAPNPFDAAPTD